MYTISIIQIGFPFSKDFVLFERYFQYLKAIFLYLLRYL
jgi:hypothetical protein